jgi:Hypothetical protein (DUF2513)
MKRDMELIRKMVLAVEEGPNGYAPDDLRIEGHTAEQLGYHAHLLIQDGFATGPITTHINGSGPSAQITALTWRGHDLADAVRDEARWRKAMGMIQEKGGAATLDIIKDVLLRLARGSLGI